MRRRNRQLVQYGLRNWLYYDKNFDFLSETEKINMKVLYSGLKQITPEERAFLAEKYRVESAAINDDILAINKGMTLREYRQLRIEHEDKLGDFMEIARDKYKEPYKPVEIPKTQSKDLKLIPKNLKEIDEWFKEVFALS